MSKSLVQIAERSTISQISSSLNTDALIELFTVDVGSVPSIGNTDILRFHAGTNNIDREIIWQGDVYYPYPIEVKGFEATGSKQIPRPSMSLANITTTASGDARGVISGLTRDYNDLVGVQVNRKRTYGRFLDNFCKLADNTVVAGTCTDTAYQDSKSDCLSFGNSWGEYDCATCAAAGGTWYVNHNTEWKEIAAPEGLRLEPEATHNHSHKVTLTNAEVCALGDGAQITTTASTNSISLVSQPILQTDGTGSILEISNAEATQGMGYNYADGVYLEVAQPPLLSDGVAVVGPASVPHAHEVLLTDEELYSLLETPGLPISAVTSSSVGHSHNVSVQWSNVTKLFTILFTTNHTPMAGEVPHYAYYPSSLVPASFNSIELTPEGALKSYTTISGGAGYRLDAVLVLLPRPTAHAHNIVLEYMYEGSEELKLVEGVNSNFTGATTSWYGSAGTTLTSVYDSSSTSHDTCLRVEASGILDWAFIDVNTFANREYSIEFDYRIVTGSTQKLVVETDNGDGTWTTEASYALVSDLYVAAGYTMPGYIYTSPTSSGFLNFSTTLYLADRSRASRTRFKIFASGGAGGSNDEILVDNFQVSQTWARGDLRTRSISGTDGHTLTYYNNLVINTSDPEAFFEDDIYFIDRKVAENKILIEFELAPAWDVEGIKLPKREIIQNTCLWKYRGGECGYTGTQYYTKDDEPTSDATKDYCAKKLTSCELRFAEPYVSATTEAACVLENHYWNSSTGSCWNLNKAILPYGGFPGVGLGLRR